MLPFRPIRAFALLVGLLVLMAVGFSAQRSVHWCRGCQAHATQPSCCHASQERPCCSGTCHCADQRRVAHPANPGWPALDVGGCDGHCCATAELDLDPVPLSRAVELAEHAPLAWLPLQRTHDPAELRRACNLPYATGPPRVAAQLCQRRSVLLLI